ncbi:MAG TPA: bacillithiol biosynthesis cysteine-adding enzyme BshC [Parachlamydiaceae bacterium]|nr:bacillithiol biosynthesis cysteine-adding enzyme BshC [Parachlamydiaceae bacterium]
MQITTQPSNKKTHEDQLASFLGMSFQDPNAFALGKQQVDGRSYPRQQLAIILDEYNRQIGNDTTALDNIKKLGLPDSYCVVTGQQLGMMGGPIYTILKGISCLLVALETGAIPIFWLATEDHDIPEIDHTYLIDTLGNLKQFHLSLPRHGSAIEDLTLTEKNIDEIKAFWNHLGLTPIALPSQGDLYSKSMAQILMHIFAGTGMVFLEPKLLRSLSKPFFAKELKECEAIQDVLKETTLQLEKDGGHPGIKIGEATNLFYRDNSHKRQKLRFDGKVFTAGKEHFTLDELLLKVENETHLFSCNVAARPVLQNTLLPVIAYIAGPSEVEYHRQLGVYHQFHGAAMPCIVPRVSATFIPAYAASILEACNLQPWNKIPRHWPDVMPELEEGSKSMKTEWLESAKRNFGADLPASALERYIKFGAAKILYRVCRKRLHKKGLPGNGLHLLRNLIHPHNKPQERVLNWWCFQANSRENLVHECLGKLSWNSQTHYYLYL